MATATAYSPAAAIALIKKHSKGKKISLDTAMGFLPITKKLAIESLTEWANDPHFDDENTVSVYVHDEYNSITIAETVVHLILLDHSFAIKVENIWRLECFAVGLDHISNHGWIRHTQRVHQVLKGCSFCQIKVPLFCASDQPGKTQKLDRYAHRFHLKRQTRSTGLQGLFSSSKDALCWECATSSIHRVSRLESLAGMQLHYTPIQGSCKMGRETGSLPILPFCAKFIMGVGDLL